MLNIDKKTGEKWGLWSLVIIISSMAFNLMKLNTFAIIALALCVILSFKSWKKFQLNPFSIALLTYFIVVLTGLLHAGNIVLELKNVESKLSLLLVGLIFAILPWDKEKTKQYVLRALLYAVLIVSFVCLILAFVYFLQTGDPTHFFYHELLLPFRHHAIFFSVMVFISIIFLSTDKTIFKTTAAGGKIKIVMLVYLWLILFLLSSKMIISVALLSTLFIYLRKLRWKEVRWIALVAVIAFAGIFSFSNPVSKRFSEILDSNFEVLRKDEIGPETYLNGLEFRLLQWKNVYEILNRHEVWLTGVSFSNSKPVLYEQYDHLRLYSGEIEGEKGGYYAYDLHNQYLQTTLQFGLIGLLVFLFILVSLFTIAIRTRNTLLLMIACVFLLFSFTESVLERQYGLILFVFIPLSVYMPKTLSKKPIE